MKKRLIRHYFNMVEIALALAVLAIGMSSILVLFPVGINANKSAIADNNLADIAEYLMGYLRAGCAAEWAKIAKAQKDAALAGSKKELGKDDFSFSGKMFTNRDSVRNLGEPGNGKQGINPLDKEYDPETGSQRIPGISNLYRLKDSGDTNSAFLYKQMTGDIVDFAAVVKVWREEYSFYALDPSNNQYKKVTVKPDDYSSSSVNQYATALCIEISWPAQAPYDQREKQLFRQEIFNEAYRYYD